MSKVCCFDPISMFTRLSLLKLFVMISCTMNLINVHALENADIVGVNATTDRLEHQQHQQLQEERRKNMPPIPNFLKKRPERYENVRKKKDYDVTTSIGRRLMNRNDELMSSNHITTSFRELDLFNMEKNNGISWDIIYGRELQDFCVFTEAQLRDKISLAPTTSPTPFRIDICVSTMNINASVPNPTFQGINIIRKNLDIRCKSTTPRCILDAQYLSRHFYIDESTVVFRGIIFQNGNGRKDAVTKKKGGSLLVYLSFIFLENCEFKNNIGSDGGAITSIASELTFDSGAVTDLTLFQNNTAFFYGGAIYAYNDSLIATKSGSIVFRNNSAGNKDNPSGQGGAIYMDSSTSSWSNAMFDGNIIFSVAPPFESRNYGGAIYVTGGKASSFTNVTFQNNRGDIGGAIAAIQSVNLTFSNTTFLKNFAVQIGGGAVHAINKLRKGILSFTDVFFRGNSAIRGSAVEANYVSISFSRVMIENNTSIDYGTCLIGSDSTIKLKDTFFKNNAVTNISVERGELVYWNSRLDIRKSSVLSKQAEICDNLSYDYNEDNADFKSNCVNLPTFIPFTRRLAIPDDFENSHHRSLQQQCVLDCAELRSRVKACTGRTKPPCRVDVCAKKRITCSRKTSSRALGDEGGPIDLSNKTISFSCVGGCGCDIDGSGETKLFIGSSYEAEFINLNFMNSLGAIQMFGTVGSRAENNDILTLSGCSFVNNSATSGSAISVTNAEVLMNGTSFMNNTGNGAPVEMLSKSTLHITESYFEGNGGPELGSGILSFDSKINLGQNVSFVKTTTRRGRSLVDSTDNCDIFVVVNGKNVKGNSSCITTDGDGTLTKRCSIVPDVPTPVLPPPPTPRPLQPTPNPPTPRPAQNPPPLPVPTRSPCFSGWNTVEVKDGNIRMDQLKIGDFVKSGNNQFTQVYGFGHLDRALEEVFIQIYFDRKSKDQADVESAIPLEISARHLLMLDTDQFQYPIRAFDVVVGNTLSGLTVQKIRTVTRHGVYAPLTHSGDLVVSGVRASNYVDVLDHNWIWNQHILGHLIFVPQRVFCSYFLQHCKNEGYINGYGYLSYLVVHASAIVNQLGSYAANIAAVFLMIAFVVNRMVCWTMPIIARRLYACNCQQSKI